ncbi:hypothetical protein G6F31_013858 [Rhizopus arrhizus]|nr:hypothetical protein G6F31_013858 [Rhizopus arrhizus]
MLELGGGTGAFAEAVLLRLAELDALPSRYAILEPSADLRERQQQRLQQNLPAELAARVDWIDRPFEEDWEGVVFANEVIDALPTPRFLIRDGEVYEETVELDAEGRFIRGAQPADILLNGAVRHIERYLEKPFAEGYRSEVLPQLPYWLQAVAGGLQRGAMLFVDYGYNRGEFYQHDRDDGTVRAFYRHHVHNDVHRWPGLQDITASVDFTAMAEAGLHGGFELAGYCSQASFLLGNGLDQVLLLAEERTDEVGRIQLRDQVKKLTLPTEMGERFQAIGLQRGVDFEPAFELAAAQAAAVDRAVGAGGTAGDRGVPDPAAADSVAGKQRQGRALPGLFHPGRQRGAAVPSGPPAAVGGRGTGADGHRHRVRAGRADQQPHG